MPPPLPDPDRDSSEDSGNEPDELLYSLTFNTEKVALKVLNKNILADEDSWPIYVLEDATILSKDGKTFADLLEAALNGPYTIQGKLFADSDVSANLLHQRFQKQGLRIVECDGFSVGFDPITLWASSRSGWFEILPSKAYRPTFVRSLKAIHVYFYLLDLYEDKRQKTEQLTIEEILVKLSAQDGSAMSRDETVSLIYDNAVFLLAQMGKNESKHFKFESTTFYKWLAGLCPDVHKKLQEKSGAPVTVLQSIEVGQLDAGRIPDDGAWPAAQDAPLATQQPAKKARGRQREESPAFQNNLEPLVGTTSERIASILKTIVDQGIRTRQDLTLAKLWDVLYRKYRLSYPPVARAVVKLHAAQIMAALGPEWHGTPAWIELKTWTRDPPPEAIEADVRKEALKIEILPRAAAPTRRAPPRKRSDSGSLPPLPRASTRSKKLAKAPSPTGKEKRKIEKQKERAAKTSRSTPPPHAGKALPPPSVGQTSILRPKKREWNDERDSNPDKEPSQSDADELADYIPRKRAKTTTPNASDSVASYSSSERIDAGYLHENGSETAPAKIVARSHSIPRLSQNTADGAWHCTHPGCSFMIRDVESAEGQEQVDAHYLFHANEITERENLVNQEALLNGRRQPNHLLEMLKQMGGAERLKHEDQNGAGGEINGKPIPSRVKRAGDI